MAKTLTQVVGIDFGRSTIKAVHLSRRGTNRLLLNGYAIRAVDAAVETPEQITYQLQQLFQSMKGVHLQNCAVAFFSSDAIIRIIEQPETPTEILREGLRLNGVALLNQDVKEFVLDCDLIKSGSGQVEDRSAVSRLRYLVGGLPRKRITTIDAAFQKLRKNSLKAVQIPAVCIFNAFEFAHPEIFNNEAFLLVDIGHNSSTITVGVKNELILVRTIEFCGQLLLNSLSGHSGVSAAEALRELQTGGNPNVTETTRLMLTALTREISSSIGFFEGRREETISRVFISGGLAKMQVILDLISEDLHMPCKTWDPFKNCEVALPSAQKQSLPNDIMNLAVACGAAVEVLKGE